HGAKAFDSIAEAVKGASHIHLTLPDDKIVDEILDLARPHLSPGAIIIDHSTTSTAGASQRTQQWKASGFIYLHAPVFMGPQNALESTGFMLVSGDQDVIKKLEPALAAMTGKLLNLGTENNSAAGVKLLGNSFLLFLTAGLSDTLALAQAMDIPSSELASLFDQWNPGAMVPARLKRLLAADYENPSWELKMARKDARLMMEEAAHAKKHLAALPAIAAEMDRWIDKGHANKDWTVIAKDNF
ncbi:MAG: NAD(P)-binding domain-containing protein, partial [Bacteroidota bacterium]